MIISRTPLRIEVTGGSDLPAFSRREPGAIVNFTIDKYIYIMVKELHSTFGCQYFLRYTKVKKTQNLKQIHNLLIQNTLKYLDIKNLDFASMADLPSQTGLGSSGSFLVGFLNALHRLKKEKATPLQLAQEACHIEMNLSGVKCGAQDQYAAAFGGWRFHQFNPDGSVETRPLALSAKIKGLLQKRLLLFYTGQNRAAKNFLSNLWQTLDTSENARKLMSKRVELSKIIERNLKNNNLAGFGEILAEEWSLKKQIAPIETTPQINRFYQKAIRAGAEGGKLVGAGGGGFLLFYAPEEKHEAIKKSLSSLLLIPFNFEPSGSRIVYFD